MYVWSVQNNKGVSGWEEVVFFPVNRREMAFIFANGLAAVYSRILFRVQRLEIEPTPEVLDKMQDRVVRLRSHLVEELGKMGKTI